MARITRGDHPRIWELVETEKRKVAEVAALYGCTPANIYAIPGRLRREKAQPADGEGRTSPVAASGEAGPALEPPTEGPPAAPAPSESQDLFATEPLAAGPTAPRPSPRPAAVTPPAASAPAAPSHPPAPARAAPPPPAPASPARPGPPATARNRPAASPVGPSRPASRARQAFGLVMRTAEGEEATHPFRSLEDLLAAAKPILRSAAQSAEPVWFSIQRVDEDSLLAEEP